MTNGAGDGDRTRTPLSGNRILSPVRMPVSPLLHGLECQESSTAAVAMEAWIHTGKGETPPQRRGTRCLRGKVKRPRRDPLHPG